MTRQKKGQWNKRRQAYDKAGDFFRVLEPLTNQAIANAKRLENYHQSSVSQAHANPSTRVHHLVAMLRNLAEDRK